MGTLHEPRRLSLARRSERRRPRARPPRGLVWILGVVLCVALTWALVSPPWQSPDEVQHFAYVQTLAQDHALPGQSGRPETSTAQAVADGAVGASRGAFTPAPAPPAWDPADVATFRALGAHLPQTDGGGPNPAAPNPPLYYAYAGVAYLLSGSASAFGELYAMRVFDVLLVLATALGGWLLAGEVLGRKRSAQVTAAAVCGLLPMETFIGTSVNPDTMMVTVWTLALWVGARVINRRASTRDVLALCALTAAAILTKGTSYALLPPSLLAVVIGWWRRPSEQRWMALGRLLPAGLVLVVPVLAWLLLARSLGRPAINTFAPGTHVSSFNIRQFLSYVWQFYLPRLPWMHPLTVTGDLGVFDIWIREGVGDFGWLVVPLPDWVYTVASVLVGTIAVGALAIVVRIRDQARLALLAFFALALVSLLGGLHLYEYQSVVAGQGSLLQGRYLLPVVGLLGLAVGLLVTRIPTPRRGAASGLVVAGLLALQMISLSALIQAYYL